MVDDTAATEAAAEAAERVIFSRFDHGDVIDFDVTVQFRGGDLTVDVFLETADGLDLSAREEQQIADDAARAAAAAVDELVQSDEE